MIRLSPTAITAIGQTPSLGCQTCPLLVSCGGVFRGWNCFSECCGKPDKCTTACFRSRHFFKVVRDAGGFEIAQKWQIGQARFKLPVYIPHVGHGYGRSQHLQTRNVALTTYDVLRVGSDCKENRLSTPQQLREHFRISPKAEILLLSIAKDNRLESYWRREVSHRLPERLAALGIQYVTAPNYSFPLNVPRPEHLVNRRRILLSAERMSAAGLNVIPHLNAVSEADWHCWRDFLKEHPHLYYVAMEFQTGLCQRFKAKWHLCQLLNLQEAIGREVHLIAVGGRRHIGFLSELPAATIVNSVPFMRTLKRRMFHRLANKWVAIESAPGGLLDDLWNHNCRSYARAVARQFKNYKQRNGKLLTADNDENPEPTSMHHVIPYDGPQLQFGFWPVHKLASSTVTRSASHSML